MKVNKIKYKWIKKKEKKIKYVYGNKKWEVTNYLVYKEDNGEKYFLPNVTAFDSIDKAKEVIDDMFKMEE